VYQEGGFFSFHLLIKSEGSHRPQILQEYKTPEPIFSPFFTPLLSAIADSLLSRRRTGPSGRFIVNGN
jgi:hypothetical protein